MKSIKNERIGISMMMNCGMKATIIAYRNYNDMEQLLNIKELAIFEKGI